MNIETLLLITIVTAILIPLVSLLQKTKLSISTSNGRVWPIIFYREILLALMPIILIQAYGVSNFPAALFFPRDEGTLKIALLVIYSISFFLISLIITLHITNSKPSIISPQEIKSSPSIEVFAISALALSILLLSVSVLLLNYKHALIHSIITGENILVTRLANVYTSSLPTQISQTINVCSWITSIQTGIYLYQRKKLKSFAFGVASITLASAGGGKAPIVMSIIISALSYTMLARPRLNIRNTLISAPPYIIAITLLTYWVVSLQVPDLTPDKFIIYLINRIGVGQMSGTYETFSIPPLEGDFFWHMIPFASQFIEYKIYDKELMLFVEGAEYTRTGVKNSLFISEAYGIGGWPLALISPAIVGISYGLGILLTHKYLEILFDKKIAAIYFMPIYILSSPITGGFSSFALLKGLILTFMVIGLIWIFQKSIIEPIIKTTKNPPQKGYP